MNNGNRPTEYPKMNIPTRAMQTFSIRAPKGGLVPISCEDVECANYARGWKMVLDLNSELGQKQAYYIKHQSGRAYTVESQVDGLVTLIFAPNQDCFEQHKVRNDLPEVFSIRGGDFRGNPLKTPTRVHKKPEFWLEEFAENQDRIATAKKEG